MPSTTIQKRTLNAFFGLMDNTTLQTEDDENQDTNLWIIIGKSITQENSCTVETCMEFDRSIPEDNYLLLSSIIEVDSLVSKAPQKEDLGGIEYGQIEEGTELNETLKESPNVDGITKAEGQSPIRTLEYCQRLWYDHELMMAETPVDMNRLSKEIPTKAKIAFAKIIIIAMLEKYQYWKCGNQSPLESIGHLMDWMYKFENILMINILNVDAKTRENTTLLLLDRHLIKNLDENRKAANDTSNKSSIFIISNLKTEDLPTVDSLLEELVSYEYTLNLTSPATTHPLVIWLRDLVLLLLTQSVPTTTASQPSLTSSSNHSKYTNKNSNNNSTNHTAAEESRIVYNARAREVLSQVAVYLGIHPNFIKIWEHNLGKEILYRLCNTQQSPPPTLAGSSSMSRGLKMGLAVIGGGALLAVTGGLAAPMVAAGLCSIGASLGAAGAVGAAVGGAIVTTASALSTIGIAGAATVFGVSGAGLTAWKLSNRLGDLKEFEFHRVPVFIRVNPSDTAPHGQNKALVGVRKSSAELQEENESSGALELCICIDGWISAESDQVDSLLQRLDEETRSKLIAVDRCCWSWVDAPRLSSSLIDTIALKWESEDLARLEGMIRAIVTRSVANVLTNYTLQHTLSSAVASAIALPAWILSMISNLDNAWATIRDKSKVAGEVLGQVLMDKHLIGHRPVSLVGYSMGAKVIIHCLEYLFKQKQFHIIQNVIIVGAPLSTSSMSTNWSKLRSVVSGRFVNGYSKSDWILGFLSRYMDWGIGVAGLHPINMGGIEDVDLGPLVSTHDEYSSYMHEILSFIGYFK